MQRIQSSFLCACLAMCAHTFTSLQVQELCRPLIVDDNQLKAIMESILQHMTEGLAADTGSSVHTLPLTT